MSTFPVAVAVVLLALALFVFIHVVIGRSGDSTDSYEYKIQLTDGAWYRFTDNLSPSVSQLGRHIEQEVTRVLLHGQQQLSQSSSSAQVGELP